MLTSVPALWLLARVHRPRHLLCAEVAGLVVSGPDLFSLDTLGVFFSLFSFGNTRWGPGGSWTPGLHQRLFCIHCHQPGLLGGRLALFSACF